MIRYHKINKRITTLLNKFTDSGNSIYKNMGVLASGSVVAKIIGLGTYPVITRIYSPEDFGVLAVFTSAVAILLPFATLRYSVTIPLPKNDGLAFNIFIMSTGLILIFVILASIILLFFGETIFGFVNMSEIASYWWLLVLGVLGGGLYELLSHWAIRMKQFIPIAKTTIWQALISSISNIGLGLLGWKPIGLLIGAVAQKGAGLLSLTRYFSQDFKLNLKEIKILRIIFLFKYYKDLPLFRLPSQFLLVFATKIPVLFFAFQFGVEATGQLGLSLAMIGIPMGLIGSNIAKVYYAEIAKVGPKNSEKIYQITKYIVKKLSIVSLLPALILIIFAPVLFQIVFGSDWEQAGIFTSILAFYLLVQFVTSPLMNVFTVYNIHRKFLEINIVRIMIIVVVFVISYYYNMDVYQTLIAYSIVISTHYIFVGLQVYKILKQ